MPVNTTVHPSVLFPRLMVRALAPMTRYIYLPDQAPCKQLISHLHYHPFSHTDSPRLTWTWRPYGRPPSAEGPSAPCLGSDSAGQGASSHGITLVPLGLGLLVMPSTSCLGSDTPHHALWRGCPPPPQARTRHTRMRPHCQQGARVTCAGSDTPAGPAFAWTSSLHLGCPYRGTPSVDALLTLIRP